MSYTSIYTPKQTENLETVIVSDTNQKAETRKSKKIHYKLVASLMIGCAFFGMSFISYQYIIDAKAETIASQSIDNCLANRRKCTIEQLDQIQAIADQNLLDSVAKFKEGVKTIDTSNQYHKSEIDENTAKITKTKEELKKELNK
jgi:hypothetical protein